MNPTIPDDPSGLEDILKEMKRNFRDGKTKTADYRKFALNSLIQGYQEMREKFSEAHKNDLGWNTFITELLTNELTVSEIKDLKDNFKSWGKTKSIKTPVTLGFASSEVTP